VIQVFTINQTLSFSYLSDWSGLAENEETYLLVKYQLNPVPEGTQLEITQTNYDEDKANHSRQNWAVVIDGLKEIVE
jgi:hypothetical protein